MSQTGTRAVVVTGAGSGIGYALVRHFAQAGAQVALNDLDGELAQRAANAINAENGNENVVAYGLDVADVPAVRRMMTEADTRFGGLDVVIANAGLTNYGPFLDYTPETFDRVMSVNLRGTFFTAQAAARAMLARHTRGRLILMSSVTGFRAFRNLEAYGVSKAGISFMAAALAQELGPHGLTVNAIRPGSIATPRTEADDPHLEENWAGVTPTRRGGQVDDVVAVAAFLASPAASHVNGQTITVDGGWSIGGAVPAGHNDLPPASTQVK